MSRKKLHKVSCDNFVKNINLLIEQNGGALPFAKQLNVSYQAVLHWSRGDNYPDGNTLVAMHNIYDVSIDWLMGNLSDSLKCPYCGDWDAEIRDACNDVKMILESDDETVRVALRSNIAAFRESIKKNRKQRTGSTHHQKGGRAREGSSRAGMQPGKAPAAKSAAG